MTKNNVGAINSVAPVLLDITRSISRFGRGHKTGIDRVERAYFEHLVNSETPTWFLARVGKQFAVLPPSAAKSLKGLIDDEIDLPRPSFRDAIRFKLEESQKRARSFIRREAKLIGGIETVLQGLSASEYYNVGHSNLSKVVLAAISKSGCAINILIHDMIPLDFPEYTKPEMSVAFENRMRSVAKYANRIICNSEYTKERVQSYFSVWGQTPEIIVAHLGTEDVFLAKQNTAQQQNPPYFVILGTIEGRKNHRLIFDIWTKMEESPKLCVVGRRGWCAKSEISFLDNSPLMGDKVQECPDLNDDEIIELLKGACGLLFPSFTEGYGLPAVEAATLGVPVIAADVPALREVLGSYAVFADPNDSQAWKTAIASAVDNTAGLKEMDWVAPTWKDHFNRVIG